MFNTYSPQASLDRINGHIAELEKMRQQIQQQPPITQNFQIAPNQGGLRFADNLEQVQKELVIIDTPYFSRDMSVLWLKKTSGDVKTYELEEIVEKDEKDLKIEFLMAQIEDLKKGMSEIAKSDNGNANEPVESEESSDASNGGKSKSKSK